MLSCARKTVDWREFPSLHAGPFAGIDEAGRGCLAGPVVAAAVVFAEDADEEFLATLDDSKKLADPVRKRLALEIKSQCRTWAVGFAWPREIDAVNILQATFRAMQRAVNRLGLAPSFLAIDGNQPLPGTGIPQRSIVGGDALVPAIAAASILAKTTRDRVMVALDRTWPGYGFARHKGYGSAVHLAAIREHGPCPQHRMTFRGVRPEVSQAWLPGISR